MSEPRRDNHMVVFFWWPCLSAFGLAVVAAICVGGLMWIAGKADPLRSAGVVFFTVWLVATLIVGVYAGRQWAGNRTIETLRQTVLEPDPLPAPPAEVRFIPTRGLPEPLTKRAPLVPGHGRRAGVVNQVGKAVSVLASRLSQRPLAGTLEATAQILEPDAPTWCKEMYTVLCKTWPTGNLTRRNFEALFRPGGAALWRKYVGGSGSGRHSDRGILDLWGVISQTGPRNSWQYSQPLDVIISLDRELERYAKAMSGLVQRSPTDTNEMTEKHSVSVPHHTTPTHQTKNQRKSV